MPMRIMGYDYGTYRKQYADNAKNYNTPEGIEADEYLSKMKKTDKFIPVITIVVYYGEKPWDGATTLHEMLDISDEMKTYVNNYKMLLVEARKNNLKLHNINNMDFFKLLGIFLDRNIPKKEAKEKAIQYCEEHSTQKSVIMTVASAAKIKINYNRFEKGDGNMCTLFEEIAKENKEEGRAEGKTEGKAEGIIETGIECGLSETDILEKLQIKLNISLQNAQEYFKKFGKATL